MFMENDNLSTQYPRLIELCGDGKQSNLVSFFETLECRMLEMPNEHQFKEYERALGCLDNDSWIYLKTKVLQKSNMKADAAYGYAQIKDCLNEAYGYEYLKEQGYTDISFIPETQSNQTPDLRAVSDGETIAVLEVKTIRPSLEEMKYDAKIAEKGKAGTLVPEDIRCFSFKYDTEVALPDGFKRKLISDIESARGQLESQAQNSIIRRITYLLIELDGKLLTGSPYDKGVVDKVGSFLSELSDDKVEAQYRFVGVFGGFVQKYNEQKASSGKSVI